MGHNNKVVLRENIVVAFHWKFSIDVNRRTACLLHSNNANRNARSQKQVPAIGVFSGKVITAASIMRETRLTG